MSPCVEIAFVGQRNLKHALPPCVNPRKKKNSPKNLTTEATNITEWLVNCILAMPPTVSYVSRSKWSPWWAHEEIAGRRKNIDASEHGPTRINPSTIPTNHIHMGKWPVPLNFTGLQQSRTCCYKRKGKYTWRIPGVGLCYIVGTFGNHGWQNDNVVKSCPVPGVDRTAGVGAAGGRVHPQILVNAQNGRGSKCVRHDMLNTTAKIGQLGPYFKSGYSLRQQNSL